MGWSSPSVFFLVAKDVNKSEEIRYRVPSKFPLDLVASDQPDLREAYLAAQGDAGPHRVIGRPILCHRTKAQIVVGRTVL